MICTIGIRMVARATRQATRITTIEVRPVRLMIFSITNTPVNVPRIAKRVFQRA